MTSFPRLKHSSKHGAIMPLANTVEKLHVDLALTVFYAEARRGSKELEQFVSQLRRVNTQTHSCSSLQSARDDLSWIAFRTKR